MQTALGPRVPGSRANEELREILSTRLAATADHACLQPFTASFDGTSVECANVVGVFRARRGPAGTGHEARGGALLLGTHFDTRPRADRESDADRRRQAIPGANDGGSGTAVLLHLLQRLGSEPLDRDVAVAFFDAEDLGDISGNPFSLGAEHFAAHGLAGVPAIDEAVILDMIGGKDMVLDIDAHILYHEPSRELTRRIFSIGAAMEAEPFTRDKPGRLKAIICDHWPFLRRGIPSCILIDIDYPPWHTHGDLPEALCERSLEITEEVLSIFLWPPRD